MLQYTIARYEVTENKQQENTLEQNYVELFLSAKRIEGCSEKSLKYYKATIEMMIVTVGKKSKAYWNRWYKAIPNRISREEEIK